MCWNLARVRKFSVKNSNLSIWGRTLKIFWEVESRQMIIWIISSPICNWNVRGNSKRKIHYIPPQVITNSKRGKLSFKTHVHSEWMKENKTMFTKNWKRISLPICKKGKCRIVSLRITSRNSILSINNPKWRKISWRRGRTRRLSKRIIIIKRNETSHKNKGRSFIQLVLMSWDLIRNQIISRIGIKELKRKAWRDNF